MVVLEMYSGCGQHGATIQHVLQQFLLLEPLRGSRFRPVVRLMSVDINPVPSAVSLVMDARGLDEANIQLLQSRAPNMKVRGLISDEGGTGQVAVAAVIRVWCLICSLCYLGVLRALLTVGRVLRGSRIWRQLMS